MLQTLCIFYISMCRAQFVQQVPIPIMPPMMMMSSPFQFVGNPFDNGMEIEYSPITQLVSSVAHLVEMHQRSKEREEQDHPINLPTPDQNNFGELYRSRMVPPLTSPKFNLIPYSSQPSSTSKLINSIPNENVPSVMWRIGDLIGRRKNVEDSNLQENLYDMTKIKGFPIVKSSEDTNLRLRDTGDEEPKSNKSWTILEIARKILGVDEIPTAREGNAIAQLAEELRKERRF